MNVFSSRITNNQAWVWPITLMSTVLGFMVMTAIVTAQRRSSVGVVDDTKGTKSTPVFDQQEKISELKDAVAKLQKDKTKLQTALASTNDSGKVLNDQLQDLKMFAGLTEIEGPGVIVTLRDAPKANSLPNLVRTIHDEDVLSVLNELWIAGAEAVSVNAVRVSSRTGIRCIGPTILVDKEPFATPVLIQAIGKTAALQSALMAPLGPIDALQKVDPVMATVEPARYLRLPAYNGSTEFKLGKLPKVSK